MIQLDALYGVPLASANLDTVVSMLDLLEVLNGLSLLQVRTHN